MLKIGSTLGLTAGLSLTLAGVPAQAGDGEAVNYDDTMQCSALYTFLGAIAETGEETVYLLDVAARWLVLAMVRDGTADGSVAGAALEPMVEALMGELDGMGEDEAAIDEFLDAGIEYCEVTKEAVAEEFAAVDTAS